MTETDLHHQIRLAKAEGHPLDWDFGLRMADRISFLEEQLAECEPYLSLVQDIDLLMDSPDGDLFQPNHSCRCQRRVAQWYREVWKPNFALRGGTRARQTFGRGRG